MSYIQFVGTGDIHLHRFRECSKLDGMDRLADGLSAWRQLLEFASEKKCSLINTGDLKHQKGAWDQIALSSLIKLLDEYSHVPVLAISGNGNHDGTGKETTGESALTPLKSYMRCHSEPIISRFDLFEGVPIALWPWQPTLEKLPAFLQEAKFQGARLLIGHGMIDGCAVGPVEYRPPGAPIKPTDFNLAGKNRQFDFALFGDIHKQQTLGASQCPIVYAGSPLAHNWGERELNKGGLFIELVWNSRTKRITEWKTTPIPVKAPRFRVIDLMQRDVRKVPWQKFKGDFVRVLMPANVPFDTEALRNSCEARHFEVRSIRVVEEIARKEEINAAMSAIDIISGYVRAVPPIEGLVASEVAKLGLKIWKEGGAK